jgi:cytochrome c553
MARNALAWVDRARFVTICALIGSLPALGADLSERLIQCLSCHGAEGQSQVENVPSLGAQMPSYSLIQLFMFREKMRLAEPMNEAAKELSNDDLQSIAAAIAALPAPKLPDDPGDTTRLERGRALTNQNHCNVCHRPDFSGQQTVPRLAGQREDYLLKTLREYKTGVRRAYEPAMIEVLQSIDDAQLVEFAYYLSHLP